MKTSETSQNSDRVKFTWKQRYTWMLIMNVLYIVLFYVLMKSYS